MSEPQFPDRYIDDLASIDPGDNYFIPVWNSVFDNGIRPTLLLDVGCGNGHFSAYAKRQTGCALYGVDGNRHALEAASAVGFTALEWADDFSRDALPFESSTFDFCLCKDLLEHLLSPCFVLQEINRVMQGNGHLLLHVPNHFPLFGRTKFLFTNNIDTFGYFPGSKSWNFPHIRFFTHQSLLELVALAGFQVLADLSFHFPAVPVLHRFGSGGMFIKRQLAKRCPSQFAEGFTLLLAKGNSSRD